MAEFSKQYCNKHNTGFEGDFDILEEFNKLQLEHYVSYICEGFGFMAIGKDEKGECILAVQIEDKPWGTVKWIPYEEIIK